MPGGLRDVAHVAGGEVEGARGRGGLEDGDAGRALQEVRPLVRRRVPVHLAHGARLQDDQRGREHGGDGEGEGVEDLDAAAGGVVELLLRPMERVAVGAG